jgi:hypothetical protein
VPREGPPFEKRGQHLNSSLKEKLHMMNEFLAQHYGTRETLGAGADDGDVAKLAEAQLLDGMLQSEGIDVDQLSGDDVIKLAYEVFGENSEIVKAAQEEAGGKCEDCGKAECECPSSEKNASDADAMGRIMAHAMVQELGEIEKNASRLSELGGSAQRVLGGLREYAGQAASKVKGKYRLGGRASEAKSSVMEALGKGPSMKDRASLIGRAGKKMAPELAAGTALALGAKKALGGKKDKEKGASAFDMLAEQRAVEILSEHGISVDDGQAKLASAVEQRAYQILAEAGYIE